MSNLVPLPKLLSSFLGYFNQGLSVVIANGAQESAAINCGGLTFCGVFLPEAFTGTSISFETSFDLGTTWVPVKSTTAGTTLSYTVAQGTYCAIDPKDFQGINFLKIKSGSAEAAQRTLICALKGF